MLTWNRKKKSDYLVKNNSSGQKPFLFIKIQFKSQVSRYLQWKAQRTKESKEFMAGVTFYLFSLPVGEQSTGVADKFWHQASFFWWQIRTTDIPKSWIVTHSKWGLPFFWFHCFQIQCCHIRRVITFKHIVHKFWCIFCPWTF